MPNTRPFGHMLVFCKCGVNSFCFWPFDKNTNIIYQLFSLFINLSSRSFFSWNKFKFPWDGFHGCIQSVEFSKPITNHIDFGIANKSLNIERGCVIQVPIVNAAYCILQMLNKCLRLLENLLTLQYTKAYLNSEIPVLWRFS